MEPWLASHTSSIKYVSSPVQPRTYVYMLSIQCFSGVQRLSQVIGAQSRPADVIPSTDFLSCPLPLLLVQQSHARGYLGGLRSSGRGP